MAAAPLRPPAFDTLSTFEKARALLHVGATPDYLPCREEEREDIQARVGDAILGQTGTCICSSRFVSPLLESFANRFGQIFLVYRGLGRLLPFGVSSKRCRRMR